MWEYWHYTFWRVVLKPGWEEYPDDWYHYLVEQERLVTCTEADFFVLAEDWIGNAVIQHNVDSPCPI